MKKLLTLIAFVATGLISVAQSHIQWTTPEITPGAQVNLLKGTNTDKFGNTYTIHFTQDPVNHYMTYRFFRYDTDGNKQWQYNNDSCFTDCQDIYSVIVPVDNDGAIFIGYYDDLAGQWQMRIKRIGLNGNLLWQNYWNVPYVAGYPVTARLDYDGNLVVAIKAIVTMPNDNDFAFAKFNITNGSNMWHFELPDRGATSGWHEEDITNMDIDTANNIYGCGHGGLDEYYFKVTPAGALDYELIVNNNDSIDDFNSPGAIQLLTGTNNDLYLLIGAGTKTWVQKYEAGTGNFLFTKVLQHDTATTIPVAFAYDNNNIYTLNNYYYSFLDNTFSGIHYTNNDYMITKIDTGGTISWEKSFLENLDTTFTFGSARQGAAGILACGSNLYVLSTYLSDSANFIESLALNKIDFAGNIVWFDTTAAPDHGGMAADSICNIYVSRAAYILNSVHVVTQKYSDNITSVQEININHSDWNIFPNPAHDVILISSALKNNFSVQVINTTGEIIIHEKNQKQLDISNLAQGIYFLRIQDENNVVVKKFVKE